VAEYLRQLFVSLTGKEAGRKEREERQQGTVSKRGDATEEKSKKEERYVVLKLSPVVDSTIATFLPLFFHLNSTSKTKQRKKSESRKFKRNEERETRTFTVSVCFCSSSAFLTASLAD
jgi:hypothetical protein